MLSMYFESPIPEISKAQINAQQTKLNKKTHH